MSSPAKPAPQTDAEKTSEANTREINNLFANVESFGVKIGLTLVIISFVLYVSGLLPAFVAVDQLPGMVSGGVDAFTQSTGLPTGWGWLELLHKSDMLTLGALVLLVGAILLAYIAMIPLCLRQKDHIYLVLVVLQLLVFLLAGSNLLSDIGH